MTTPAPSPTAQAAHERLFPGHTSTLAVTDPELIAYFDDFAFDETLRHAGNLPERTRLMTQLAAMIAVGALAEYRVMLGAALTVGVTPVQAKEIVYQAVPYAGMARVFDFLHATNTVLTDRGVQLPLEGRSRPRTAAHRPGLPGPGLHPRRAAQADRRLRGSAGIGGLHRLPRRRVTAAGRPAAGTTTNGHGLCPRSSQQRPQSFTGGHPCST